MFLCFGFADYSVNRQAAKIGLSEEHYSALLQHPQLSSTVSQMTTALHMALAFSPLLALVPHKLADDGPCRDHLIAVSFLFQAFGCKHLFHFSMQSALEMTS